MVNLFVVLTLPLNHLRLLTSNRFQLTAHALQVGEQLRLALTNTCQIDVTIGVTCIATNAPDVISRRMPIFALQQGL